MTKNIEHQLQSKCVLWFSANHNGLPKALWANFSETLNQIEGGIKSSLGLKKDIPDLFYCPDRKLIGIEMKAPITRHNTEHVISQAKWLLAYPSKGYFCDTFDMFKNIIKGGKGIDPQKVIDYLNTIKTKTFKWDRTLFGCEGYKHEEII